jgi:hypothetical protein
MRPYDVNNWYWYVGGDRTKAFSSAAGDYVLANDATFAAFLADGNPPTVIDTEANLGDVLAQNIVRPVNANVLDGYKQSQATTVIQHKMFKVLFNHENRIRAIERQLGLNGSPANLTAQQAMAIVKGLM